MDAWYAVQVTQKDKAGRPHIDALFRKSNRIIIPLTVREILDEQMTRSWRRSQTDPLPT